MKYRVTLESVIAVTKHGITPIACWPLPPDASTSKIWRRSICWWLAFIHQMISLIPLFYNIYVNNNDADVIIVILSEMTALVSLIAKMMICRIEATHLQGLLGDLQKYLKQATVRESKVLQFYVDQYLFSHASMFACAIAGPIIYNFVPLLTSQRILPANGAYPFSIEPVWVWAALYLSESILVCQVGSMAILDFIFAIMIWFTSARFEMLSTEFKRAVNVDDVRCCIRKHQELIEYVERLKAITRIMACVVATISMLAITVGGVILIHHPSVLTQVRYALFVGVATLELLLYSWPADNLVGMSRGIGTAAFECAWIGKSPRMIKDLTIVIQRAQIPMIISVDGVLPPLSLKFYGNALTASFSYITALRAMASK